MKYLYLSLMSTHIRSATLEDIPNLVKLRKEIADYHIGMQYFYQLKDDVLSTFAKHLEQLLATNNHYIPLLYEEDEIIGHAIVRLSGAYPIYIHRPTGFIEEFYIVPSMQNKGYGKILLDDLYAWFAQHKVEKIDLNAMVANTSAVNFWRRNGFTDISYTMGKEM